MKKVLIIGCGYAGAVSAWRLSRLRKKVEVTVVDRSKNFNFLPLLPDCLGRGIPAGALFYPIQKLSSIYGFNFINQEVKSLDVENRRVFTSGKDLNYDYLIIASGSQTNFYGNEIIKKHAYKLDDAQDAKIIRDTLDGQEFDSYIIAGAGYTGIEVATNLKVHLERLSKRRRVIIVERAPAILGPLPEWMKDYVADNLKQLDIEVFTNAVIDKIEGGKIYISGRGEFRNSMLIWAAGVRTADFLQNLDVDKNPQGRIKVDEYLRLNENCFVIGDAAYFSYKDSFLRMAVQFAIAQGSLAVYNITNSILGKDLRKYQPMDLGYIIPMANNRACGNVLGINVRGLTPIIFHYIMSIYRAYGFKNKLGIIKTLV